MKPKIESEQVRKVGKKMLSVSGRNAFPVKIELLTENSIKGKRSPLSTFVMLLV